VSQPAPKPSWKEEVNRRLEAHKTRRGLSVVDQQESGEEHNSVSGRAAQAAARVAARYAKAPSYSEMQAAEARAALRTAEAATRVALEAQAAAQVALDNIDAAEAAQYDYLEDAHEQLLDAPQYRPESPTESILPPPAPPAASSLQIRWEPDMPALPLAPPPVPERREPETSAPAADWIAGPNASVAAPAIESVDAAQPIHANLIQFPRELVATRRMRPRLSGPPQSSGAEQYGQLSIFEVDPSSICIEPTASTTDLAAPAPSWSGPEWSGIELDSHPDEEREFSDEPPTIVSGIHLAPLELRLMASAVDFALIVGLVSAAVWGIAGHLQHPPALKSAEMMALAAVLLTGVLYQAFFLLVTLATPGMMYARIALCTFDDELPTRAQLRQRLGALVVSLLPVGLGMAWSIFDEDRLSWHDRLSQTYLRRC
jgi:uncharacterized RDD family membrane protein YckC